jgi:intracellular sulfur oxidation DsrE/DsrF family protein
MRHLASAAAAAAALMITIAIATAHAETAQDTAALSGLDEAKVAFDLQNGNSAALLKQLEVIEETRQSLIKQRVRPDIVITFRGPATKLVQTDQSQISTEDRENAAKIAEKINALHAAEGVSSVAQCAIAVRLAGTNPENVLPAIKLVGNGWISLMAYQAKGYGYIAP